MFTTGIPFGADTIVALFEREALVSTFIPEAWRV
jgi:hypothetical protein